MGSGFGLQVMSWPGPGQPPMGAPRGKLGWRHFAQRAVRAVLVIIFAEGLYFFFGVFEVYKLLLV